jgi:hypothetical protein
MLGLQTKKPENKSPIPDPSLPQAGDSLRDEMGDRCLWRAASSPNGAR